MNNMTKQIVIAVSAAVFSAACLGLKTVYDDVADNTHHRTSSDKTIEKIHDKLDMIILNQNSMQGKISVLESNQNHLIEGRFRIESE